MTLAASLASGANNGASGAAPAGSRLRWRERELAGIAASLREDMTQDGGRLACT